MGSRAAGRRYAKAIIELAQEENLEDKVLGDFTLIHSTIDENKDLKLMLSSPLIEVIKKQSVLLEVFKSVQPLVQKLIKTLAINNRISILEEISEEYISLYNTQHHIQYASVITAAKMTKDIEEKVQNKIKEITGYTANLTNQVDESILGGFVLRLKDLQFDASVSTSLNRFKRQLL
ncbi:ATP synthase F1 subunit delta [Psychroflexus sp. MES1-P1E]|jgi:F-type H+-transporting ATPase subunit delta|uniref:ATP synthase F1 subunit delta n=1 Tax=Psychroflexus sp. MES1-P1E TaxID=2058320 RepID=UPI000C7DFED5|nr:ATP synthase F1 subunit delta [Psychroflexus sp. MES1-P1E]PKG41322.1 ATP synthase F1 subunit delta [Psychroflexus sp. MES1-P1E]